MEHLLNLCKILFLKCLFWRSYWEKGKVVGSEEVREHFRLLIKSSVAIMASTGLDWGWILLGLFHMGGRCLSIWVVLHCWTRSGVAGTRRHTHRLVASHMALPSALEQQPLAQGIRTIWVVQQSFCSSDCVITGSLWHNQTKISHVVHLLGNSIYSCK